MSSTDTAARLSRPTRPDGVAGSPAITDRRQLLAYERTLDCVHCGLCLPSCPTYTETARESQSPRGRIYLMRALCEKRLEPSRELFRSLDQCLVCRACEKICPSGVRMGQMVAFVRNELETLPLRPPRIRRLKRLAFRHLLPRHRFLSLLAGGLAVYQRSRARRWLHLLGLDRGRLQRVLSLEDLLPRIPPRRLRRPPPEVSPPIDGNAGDRVALLVGCAAHQLTPGATWSAIRVLNRHGATVHCPASQPCCGALAMHYGDLEGARRLARRAIDAMLAIHPGRIIVTAAGCGAAMKEYGDLLSTDPAYAAGAREVAEKVIDINEYLDQAGLEPPGSLRLRVAYDDACHLLHAQGVREAPRRILGAIPGLELTEAPDASVCCGAAGIYNILEPEMSKAILERKIESLREMRPDAVATANPGCVLQIRAGLRRAGIEAEVVHPIELLDRAYQGRSGPKRSDDG